MCVMCQIKTAVTDAIDQFTEDDAKGAVAVRDLLMATSIEFGPLPAEQGRRIAVNLPDNLTLLKFEGWRRDTRTTAASTTGLIVLDPHGLAALFAAITDEASAYPDEVRAAFWNEVTHIGQARERAKAGDQPAGECECPDKPAEEDTADQDEPEPFGAVMAAVGAVQDENAGEPYPGYSSGPFDATGDPVPEAAPTH